MINATLNATFVSLQHGTFTNKETGEVINYYRLHVLEDGNDYPTFYKASADCALSPIPSIGCPCVVALEVRRFGSSNELRAVGIEF